MMISLDLVSDPQMRLVFFIVFGCCFIPIFALVVVCFIKLLLKQKKRVSKSKNNSTIRYLDYFGGDDNIISVTKNLSRVSVIVKDVDLVNLESIKNQGIGDYRKYYQVFFARICGPNKRIKVIIIIKQ